jgi:imidazolonepropionase-like amidohydrolase
MKKIVRSIVLATLVIPGDGEPFANGAVVTELDEIVYVGPEAELPHHYYSQPHKLYGVPFLMPGLWDVHVHFMGASETDPDVTQAEAFAGIHPASAGARLGRQCWESLQRGYGCEIAQAIDDGSIIGPNIYSSGACISQTAGHGDIFELPAGDAILNIGVSQVTPGHYGGGVTILADGVDECRRAVRLQIRRGAKCLKILASGGVMSRDDNPKYAQFSKDELDAIMEEANRFERSVAAHVHGKAGIIAAVKAGVTTVEHVSYADQECIDLIKKHGTIFVATRFVVEQLLSTGGKGLNRKVWEKAQTVGAVHMTAYKLAIDNGVTMALGTDSSPGANQAVELEYAVKAGMSSLEAIKAATANAPLTVKGQVPKTGQLRVGYKADMLGVWENPVEDVRVLQKKSNIGWVWKGGKIYKGPGVGPWGEEES